MLSPTAISWLCATLDEAAECLRYDARNALRFDPAVVDELRGQLQAWRDALVMPPIISRPLVEQALEALRLYRVELPATAKPAPAIARAHLLLQEALAQ